MLYYAMENYVSLIITANNIIAELKCCSRDATRALGQSQMTSYSSAAASINVCSRNEPYLSQCIIASVKELQPRLGSGRIDPNFIVPVSIIKSLLPSQCTD